MKAVIMAGGEGSRLRPLTCTLPKPMARILGKPIIEYIFDVLSASGIDEAAVTLGYLPHIIENHYESGYKNIKLDFIRDEEPLGTAGSVKNAASGFKEPFVVISGDALCDFDIEKITAYHNAVGAAVTIVAANADDPREYGVVKVDKENRVTGFIEKPSWSQAVSNLANTGVYIINPECLELIPNGKRFDFAADLFPLMLKKNMPIYCYHTAEYWCDVGNIEAYLKCQRDVFDGKIKAPSGCAASGVFVKDKLPDGDYSIVPPVYIGKNVEIADGAEIGPYTVVDDNCYIGKNAGVRHSVVLENSCIANSASVTGALICSGAAIKRKASMFEGGVAGSGCVIGEGASIKPGVMVWPGKIIGKDADVSENVKYGSVRSPYMGENGFDEKGGVRLNAETCVKLGAATGGTGAGKRVGIANDGSKTADVMQLAVEAGLASVGSTVWNFGTGFEAKLNFLVNFCGLEIGLFISGRNGKAVRICGEGGLSVKRRIEREIESAMSKCEFKETSEESIKEISDMTSIGLLYNQELMKQAPLGLQGVGASFKCENETIKNLIEGCVLKLGAYENNKQIFLIDETGTKLSAVTETAKVDYERLLAVCCFDEMKKGKDIAVSYDAPAFLDLLAEACERKVYRYLKTPADESDSTARSIAAKQIFVRDGLFMAVKLLSVMKERECNLEQLVSELPEKYIVKKTISIGFSPSYLSEFTTENTQTAGNNFEGVKILKDGGRILIIPERSGESVKILAEADTMEAAQELCADVEDIIAAAEEAHLS